MKPRQLLIIAGVVIVAFAVAFGIAGSGGSPEEESRAASAGPEPAEVIDVGGARVDASVPAGGDLPALEVPVKKPDPPATTGGGGTTATPPTTTQPTPPTTTEPTPPTTTQPTPPVTTEPAPTDPSPPSGGGGGGGGPISTGGGED